MKPKPAILKESGKAGRPTSPLGYVALIIASGFGSGYAPIAPGTFGSLVGVALYLAVLAFQLPAPIHYATVMVVSLWLCYVGIWASTKTAEMTRLKDPGLVTVDEVAGQFIAYAFLPVVPLPSIWLLVVGFFLFRLFDIVKPFPVRQLEHLEGGLGIMADDIAAGLLVGVLLYLLSLSLM